MSLYLYMYICTSMFRMCVCVFLDHCINLQHPLTRTDSVAEETTFSLLRAVKSAKVPLSFSQLRNLAAQDEVRGSGKKFVALVGLVDRC